MRDAAPGDRVTEPGPVAGSAPPPRRSLPPAGWTGIGSLPGEDIATALEFGFDRSPDLPWLPELPARGPGSDLLGRTLAAMLAATGEIGFDLQPSGWRLVSRPGMDARRAVDRLRADLDALESHHDHDGAFKVQLAGCWTLAAAVTLPRGGPALGDPSAVGDLAAGVREAVAWQAAAVRERMPAAVPVLQLDEPGLPYVLAGRVPTDSGYGRLPAVSEAEVSDLLAGVIAAAALPVAVHCCAADPPLRLLADAGAAAVSWDATSLAVGGRPDEDALAELVERGVRLWPGVLPARSVPSPPPADLAGQIRRLWRGLGFPAEWLPEAVTLTPACGLAGASEAWCAEVFARLRDAARELAEAPERLVP